MSGGGILNPGQKKKDSIMDIVAKGLQVARDVYGIKEASSQLDAIEEERQRKADNEAALKEEKKRIAGGRLTKGEQVELGAKGFVRAGRGEQADFEAVDDQTGGLVGFVKKQTPSGVRPPVPIKTVENGQEVTKFVTPTDGAVYVQPPKKEAGPKEPKDFTRDDRKDLQAQYDKDPQVRRHKTVLQSYEDAEALMQDPSPAADLSLIYAYMKALDPGSVVRETEADTAQALGSMMERAKAKFAEMAGDGRLTPAQRADMVAQIGKLAQGAAKGLDSIEGQFSTLATKRNVSPTDLRFSVRPQFKEKAPESGGAVAGAKPASIGAPSGGNGTAVAAPKPTPEDTAAIEWLKSNPSAPGAEEVRQTLKAKGLL